MSKNKSISRRNKMSWHTPRDDTIYTSMRSYETYYAFACGEKTPKLKYVRKKADSDTSPKQKSVQATKGTRIKTKSKVAKSDKNKQPAKKTKAKGLAVLYEVALTKAKQLKLATKISKKDFNITNANGSSDEVDTQSKVPDDHQLKTSGTDEGTGTIPGVPIVTNLKKDLSEIKQVNHYAQAPSSILAIVGRYIDNKLREAINKAIQAYNFDYVATLVIERNVIESLEADVLTRSSSQPQSSYEAAATLSEFELTKILIEKMEKNKSFDVANYKRELYDALIKSYNTDKDIFESYGEVFSLKRSRD
nr:hypothetical protein [Tanacetum cinerariifolium]